jgi:hypothetical protein
MKVTLDLDQLLNDEKITQLKYEKLSALAAKSTSSGITMKIHILTLLCAFAIYDLAVADDTLTLLKTMESEKEVISRLKGSSKTFYAENCPKYLPFWQRSAEQGQAIAQSFLGVCYSYGKGLVKDEAQALAWYRKAADQGYAPAQANLGVMYRDGKGIAKDEAQAIAWLRKAAEQGYVPAQINLGSIYANSKNMAKDEAQAVNWFSKAAEQGHPAAQANLGVMFRDGKGITKDEDQAMTWFRKAEEQDVQNAMLVQFRQLCKEYDDSLSEALKTATYKKSLEIINNINKNKINDWVGILSKINTDQENTHVSLSITIGTSIINDRAISSETSVYNAARVMRENQKVIFSGVNLADYNFTERKKLCEPNFEIKLTDLSEYTNPGIPTQATMPLPTEQSKPMEVPVVNVQAPVNVSPVVSLPQAENPHKSTSSLAGLAINSYAQSKAITIEQLAQRTGLSHDDLSVKTTAAIDTTHNENQVDLVQALDKPTSVINSMTQDGEPIDPIVQLAPLIHQNDIAPKSNLITEEQNKASPPPAQAAPITAKVQDCLDLAKTGMIGNAQEVMCDFKGRIQEKFMRIYANDNCDNFVTKDDLDKTRTAVFIKIKNKLKQTGEKSYCTDAKDYYNGVAKALNSVNQ